MNKKQGVVLFLSIVCITLIVIYTPRYKITVIDSKDFITTEQSSSLYKRSKGTIKLHWDKITTYSGITAIACGLALLLLSDKNG